MNKLFRTFTLFMALLAALAMATVAFAQDKKTAAGEEFFIVASVDQPHSQLLLKHPTEVTTLLTLNDHTHVLDEKGNAIRLSDLRAGDTVWVVASGTSTGAVAVRIRKGSMTVEELHRYYLDYPEIK